MPITDEAGWSPPCPKDQLLPDTYRYKGSEKQFICGNGHNYTHKQAVDAVLARNHETVSNIESFRRRHGSNLAVIWANHWAEQGLPEPEYVEISFKD